MRLFLFGILGVLVQGGGLVAFILVSRTNIGDFGKPSIICISGILVLTLLWEGVRRSRGFRICLLPITLALGYGAAFHLAGILWFPGLLNDSGAAPVDYLWSTIHVFGTLFIIYGIAAMLFFALNRGFRRIRVRAGRRSL